MHSVYILRSISDPERHYVGLTEDLKDRLARHNAGRVPASAEHAPWDLLVEIRFSHSEPAMRFERYLKTGSGRAFAKRHFG